MTRAESLDVPGAATLVPARLLRATALVAGVRLAGTVGYRTA